MSDKSRYFRLAAVGIPHRFSDQTCLRFAVAPERREEVFDPLDLAAPDFAEAIFIP